MHGNQSNSHFKLCRWRGLWKIFLVVAIAMPAEGRQASRVRMSLQQAVRLALGGEGNTDIRLAEERVRLAQSQSDQQKAALLPRFSGSLTAQNRTTNLEAMGIAIEVPLPGFESPRFVGPFSTFDARTRLSQALLDWSAIRRYRAFRLGVDEAQSMSASMRNDVAARTAMAYTAALQAEARVEAAEANVALARSLLELAADRREAGGGTAIEVTRAQVELANERQLLLSSENQSRRARLELLEAMHLPLDTSVELQDDLEAPLLESFDPADLEDPVQTALTCRADLRAQQERQERAGRLYDAVRAERWPSLHGFADYGALGRSPADSLPTRTVGVDLQVPLFDGGRRRARESETRSEFAQQRIRGEALERDVELEVRLAIDDLETARSEGDVAEEGLQLAMEEFERAERRFRAGVTTNIEVIDSQTRLERARENQIVARGQLRRARIELGRATGIIENVIFGDREFRNCQ